MSVYHGTSNNDYLAVDRRESSSSSPMPPTPRPSISDQGCGSSVNNDEGLTVSSNAGSSSVPLPLPSPGIVFSKQEDFEEYQTDSRQAQAYHNGVSANVALPRTSSQAKPRQSQASANSLSRHTYNETYSSSMNSLNSFTSSTSNHLPPRVSSYNNSSTNISGLTRSTSSSAGSSSSSTPKPMLNSRSTSTGARFQRVNRQASHGNTISPDETIAEALSAKLKSNLALSTSPSASPPPVSVASSPSLSTLSPSSANGTNSPALGSTPPTQWAASAIMNGGIASVSPDVHARILTFQQSRQSRSNSGSNAALNFIPGSVPLLPNDGAPAGSPSSPNLVGLTGGNMCTPQAIKDNLSRSSSSSSSSSYSNYSRTISSYSSPIVSPHPEDKGSEKLPPARQLAQPLQLSQKTSNLQIKIPSTIEDSDGTDSGDDHGTANPTIESAATIVPSADSSLNTPQSATQTGKPFSGALFINSVSQGTKIPTQRPSLSERRGLKLSDMSQPPPIPKLKSHPLLPSTGTGRSTSLLDRRMQASAPAGLFPKWSGKLNMDPSSERATPNISGGEGDQANGADSGSGPGAQAPVVLRPPGVGGFNRQNSLFSNYKKYVDVKSGSLNFAGKASLHSKGVDFSSGSSFRISIDEFEPMGELGRGNYGTVTKVLHKPTKVIMAMKEIRLELDETKFRQILMELEILHKCDSPYIVDFYGAFFVEGAVYMCMEYMDGGSLNNIYQGGVEDRYLAIITDSVVRGLKKLKDEHNIIHRDVKPTNILVSTSGKVKLCDFGVSGNLVASIARTNVGCQSYMAPERIRSKNPNEAITYTVESDIWSLGLSLIEIARGEYPYPADTHNSIYSQLMAILDGEPPCLPDDKYSPEARAFVAQCLNKTARLRPSYAELLKHPWLVNIEQELAHSPTLEVEFGAFVKRSVERNNHREN
ncbi:mitogen-activated protein kinase kinase PBS2 [Sugiyamaella lignohabitans]|uniref:mitogen-activated protein kinase kinase n=1 Tax=Sugiyamaella lignohabitans TaxID=796027 RepID=A0A167ETV3_9ASCO|nr:mitogen-activated protein kinase kinase PBS2 [Sugiyamaella lignohabitans]ANB14445.1 mitogen-activated protein kinase kinase PBS2 [Sugiyamaella lignohabitans]